MWDLAVREEDYDAIDAMLSRFAKAPLSMRLLPVFARGDSAARARFVDEATNSDSRQSQISARYVATFLEDFDAAESLARLDLAERRRPPIRLGAQLFLAWLELARGKWSAANASFERAKRMEGASGVEFERAMAATLPFLQVPSADLAQVRTELEQFDANAGSAAPAGLAGSLRPHLRLYLLSLLSSRMGDDQNATRYAAELEGLAAPPQVAAVARALVQTGRADVALRNGKAAEALTLLDHVQGEVPLELIYLKVFATVPRVRSGARPLPSRRGADGATSFRRRAAMVSNVVSGLPGRAGVPGASHLRQGRSSRREANASSSDTTVDS
jgi:hypothetical protein